MIDAQLVKEEVIAQLSNAPFADAACLDERWSVEVAGYRWDEPLIIEVWRKLNNTYFARSTRQELGELLSTGKSPEEALSGFLMRFKLERKLWKAD